MCGYVYTTDVHMHVCEGKCILFMCICMDVLVGINVAYSVKINGLLCFHCKRSMSNAYI